MISNILYLNIVKNSGKALVDAHEKKKMSMRLGIGPKVVNHKETKKIITNNFNNEK